jgi:hypothetical protein
LILLPISFDLAETFSVQPPSAATLAPRDVAAAPKAPPAPGALTGLSPQQQGYAGRPCRNDLFETVGRPIVGCQLNWVRCRTRPRPVMKSPAEPGALTGPSFRYNRMLWLEGEPSTNNLSRSAGESARRPLPGVSDFNGGEEISAASDFDRSSLTQMGREGTAQAKRARRSCIVRGGGCRAHASIGKR